MLFKRIFISLLAVTLGLLVTSTGFASPQDAAKEWLNKASTLYSAKEYDKSIAALTEAIKIDPKMPEAYFARAFIYDTINKKYALAIKDYSMCIKLAPNVAMSYNERGICYQHLGYYDLALADFSKVIELSPRSPGGYVNRGNLYAIKEDYQKAIRDFDKALRIDDKSPSALFNMAQVLELTDRKFQSAEHYELALKYMPEELLAERAKAEARINGDWDSYNFWM